MDDIVLQVNNITKIYKGVPVLNNASLTVHRGDIYGFVGANGAGKTTLIRIISGLIHADSGDFTLLGAKNTDTKALQAARKKICTMVESPAIYGELTAYENMKTQCIILKRPTSVIPEILKLVNLETTGKKKAKDFSLGMKQRLGLAISLLSEPEFMLLDEPINGLDPEGIKQIRELLIKLNKEKGVTILISSHILTELSIFATTYGFIDYGVILKEVDANLINGTKSDHTYIETDNNIVAIEVLTALGYSSEIQESGIIIHSTIDLMDVCEAFKARDIRLTKHIHNALDLENYFMRLIERN